MINGSVLSPTFLYDPFVQVHESRLTVPTLVSTIPIPYNVLLSLH